MLEGANFILLKGLWDAHGVSYRTAEPTGRRSYRTLRLNLVGVNYILGCLIVFLSYLYPTYILRVS